MVFVLSVLCAIAALAITWVGVTVDDPIVEGDKCQAQKPSGYGSYIYAWPSEYDQVFWPVTEKQGIWHCNKSGLTAFIGEFKGLSDKEKIAISKYLMIHHKGMRDIESR